MSSYIIEKPVKANFSQDWSKLFLTYSSRKQYSPCWQSAVAFDVFVSTLPAHSKESHFPWKRSNIIVTDVIGQLKNGEQSTKQFWETIYNNYIITNSFIWVQYNAWRPSCVKWMGQQLESIVVRLSALCTSIPFLCSCLSSPGEG